MEKNALKTMLFHKTSLAELCLALLHIAANLSAAATRTETSEAFAAGYLIITLTVTYIIITAP